jgi:hypothetical protein
MLEKNDYRYDDLFLTFLDDRRNIISSYWEERKRFHSPCTENNSCGECEGISHCQECTILTAEGNIHCLQCSEIVGEPDDLYRIFLDDKLGILDAHDKERHTYCMDNNKCGRCEGISHCCNCSLLIGIDEKLCNPCSDDKDDPRFLKFIKDRRNVSHTYWREEERKRERQRDR